MNKDIAQRFVDDWLNAWNEHDLERIIGHYAEVLEFKSPLIVERYSDPTGTIKTRDHLKEYFEMGLNKNPNLKFELINIAVGVDGLSIFYKNARGGHTAEYFEFNAAGKVTKSISCYS